MDTLGFCPIPIVCGVNRLGKTKSAMAVLSLIGNTQLLLFGKRNI